MSPVDLTLPFLEQRTYLHGTTLFDELCRHVGPDGALSLKISSRIESNRVRFFELPDGHGSASPAATFDWRNRGVSISIGVVPLPPVLPVERKPYDESRVTRSLSIGAEEVGFAGVPPFSLVAMLVPMFKVLLKDVHRAGDRGQWMFTRLDLDPVPSSFTALGVRLDRILGGTIAKARVNVGGEPCGAIYYSWV